METCFVNLVEPGDTVIIGVNGVFGERMCEVARRCGAEVVRVEAPWGRAIDPQRLLDAQREHPGARLLAVVHAETSTGVENDIAPLAALQDTDTLLLVDMVTSLGGIPVEVDAWGIDAVYSGTQKCLGVPPGLSPVSFSDRAVERVRGRSNPPQSWYLDLGLIADYVGQRASLPPHRADLDALRVARRARRAARRRARSVVGAPRAGRRAAPGRAARARLPALRRGAPAPAAHVGVAPRRRRRRARCAASCSTASTSRSAAGSARSPARAGASASWATAPASTRSPPSSAPSTSSSNRTGVSEGSLRPLSHAGSDLSGGGMRRFSR